MTSGISIYCCSLVDVFNVVTPLKVGAHEGRSGQHVLFLVAMSFSKLQTFLNNNPEGNPLKSVYLTPKIAFIFKPMWSLNGRVAYLFLSTFLQ